MKVEARDYLLMDERVHPQARELFLELLRRVRAQGIPLVVVEVYRSKERQRMLYAQGRTDEQLRARGYTQEEIQRARKAGYTSEKKRVTNVMNAGMHSKGRAMDCAFLVDGKLRYDVRDEWWQAYGKTAKQLGLVWGGDWKMADRPHVEYRGEL